MSSLNNLQRDQFWIDPSNASVSFPTVSSRLSTDGTVYQDVGYLYVNATSDASATNQMIGVMIQQPSGENTPYRIKAYTSSSQGSWTIGYASTTTGTNDTVSSQVIIPITSDRVLDEVINIKSSSGSDPLFFGLATSATSVAYSIMLSVQRLNVAPPRFSSAVS
jgi:hypothetical protein